MILSSPTFPKPKIYDEVVDTTERLYDIIKKDFNEKVDADQYMFSKVNGAIYVTGNIKYSIKDILPDVDMISIEYYIYICFGNQDYINIFRTDNFFHNDFDYEKKHLRIIGFQLKSELMPDFKPRLYSKLDNLRQYHSKEKIYNTCIKFINSDDDAKRIVGELCQYNATKKLKEVAKEFYLELAKENTEKDFSDCLENFSVYKKIKGMCETFKNDSNPKYYDYKKELNDNAVENTYMSLISPLRDAYRKYILDFKPHLINEKVKQLNEFEKMKVWYNNLSYGLESFYDEYQQEK